MGKAFDYCCGKLVTLGYTVRLNGGTLIASKPLHPRDLILHDVHSATDSQFHEMVNMARAGFRIDA